MVKTQTKYLPALSHDHIYLKKKFVFPGLVVSEVCVHTEKLKFIVGCNSMNQIKNIVSKNS